MVPEGTILGLQSVKGAVDYYRVLEGTPPGYCRVLEGTPPGYCRVPKGTAEYSLVPESSAGRELLNRQSRSERGYFRVPKGTAGQCRRVLQATTEYPRVLWGIIGYYRSRHSTPGYSWVL